jgi:cyclopropane fatty-acyl-phospholipid synthase-like methyltransferase
MSAPDVVRQQNPSWQYDNLRELLIACVGHNFGPEPDLRLDDIRSARGAVGRRIVKSLQLKGTDTVVDLGSGCGFAAREVAPHVAQLFCLDVSKDFLAHCRGELASMPNVTCLEMGYAAMPLPSAIADAVYATAVFIHFNYYDVILYLREINRVLRDGGRLLFDFLNSDTLVLENEPAFMKHIAGYRGGREKYIFNVMHPASMQSLFNLAPQVGYRVLSSEFVKNSSNTTVVLEKVATLAQP